MIADLHCHYPMHLFPEHPDPRGSKAGWLGRLKDVFESGLMRFIAKLANDVEWGSGWRVSLEGLERGGAGIVCSVLYWPPAEFDPAELHGKPPLPEYFEDIEYQRQNVEEDLLNKDPTGARVIVAKQAADLDVEDRIVFVHCVEGGMQLGLDNGADPKTIDEKVHELADQGVVYITLAHLFYREVATNAPAIPMLEDCQYEQIFHQPGNVGLTDLGKAAVRAMYKYSVLIDVSHMSERAITDTFALVEELDGKNPQDQPTDYPLIATHVGMRSAVHEAHEYNLSDAVAKRIHDRGGLIGLITCQHWMGTTHGTKESQEVIGWHLKAIEKACGDHAATAIGTDIDGFVKPTLAGFGNAPDFKALEAWIRANSPQQAEAILHENARRVLKQAFTRRAQGTRVV